MKEQYILSKKYLGIQGQWVNTSFENFRNWDSNMRTENSVWKGSGLGPATLVGPLHCFLFKYNAISQAMCPQTYTWTYIWAYICIEYIYIYSIYASYMYIYVYRGHRVSERFSSNSSFEVTFFFGVVGFRIGSCIVSDLAARDSSQLAFADWTNLPTNTPGATHLEMWKERRFRHSNRVRYRNDFWRQLMNFAKLKYSFKINFRELFREFKGV